MFPSLKTAVNSWYSDSPKRAVTIKVLHENFKKETHLKYFFTFIPHLYVYSNMQKKLYLKIIVLASKKIKNYSKIYGKERLLLSFIEFFMILSFGTIRLNQFSVNCFQSDSNKIQCN